MASESNYADLVEQYKRDGFVIIRNILDTNLIHECQQHIEHLQRKYPDIPSEHYHHIMMRNDPFWIRLVSDKRLLDLATVFGSPFIQEKEGVALFSSHYFCKPPKTGMAVLWHQDGSYWPLRPMNVLTMWLAIDDSDTENGCLRVIRGSHTNELAQLKDDVSIVNVLGSYTHRDEDIDQSKIVDLALSCLVIGTPHEARKYISPTTQCLDPKQPVMMMRGSPIDGINTYHSWPKYRSGYDLPFDGCETWNERRKIVDEDEEYFQRIDYNVMENEIKTDLFEFISKLG
ncbi:unnamed protein product, partial [Didymodactylos carnosus]